MADKVNKHTRAGKNGKRIYCPECNSGFTVYHFSWSALTCNECGEMIEKQDCLLEPRQYRSRQGRSDMQQEQTYKVLEFTLVLSAIILIYLLLTNGN